MGFNPRLAPYSVRASQIVRESSKDAGTAQEFAVFRFPVAGQLIGAYANIRRVTSTAAAADAGVEATTGTGVESVSFWKYAATDTTATYATGLRAYQRTGTQDTSTGGGLNWHLPTVADSNGLYTFSENNTAASARRQFAAGDIVMLHFDPYGGTDAHRTHQIDYQLDYIPGYEDAD